MDSTRRDLLRMTSIGWATALGVLPNVGSPLSAQDAQSDARIRTDHLIFTAADRRLSRGIYHRPSNGNPKTAVIIMHPRVNMTQHFLARPIAAAGYGALGCAPRWENNDTDALQEAT